MLNEKVRSEEALRIGLVSKVFPAATFRADVAALAEGLAAAPPLALKRIKVSRGSSLFLLSSPALPFLSFIFSVALLFGRVCSRARVCVCVWVFSRKVAQMLIHVRVAPMPTSSLLPVLCRAHHYYQANLVDADRLTFEEHLDIEASNTIFRKKENKQKVHSCSL